MQSYFFISRFCLMLFLALNSACIRTSSQKLSSLEEAVPTHTSEQRASDKERIGKQISKDEAISKANEDAAKSHQSLSSFKIVACERARLWVIIFDGGGPEYYIDKMSGAILSVEKLPQRLNASVLNDKQEIGRGIGETEAIEIAKKHFVDFLVSYGDAKEHVNEYDAVACEMTNAWRVFFEYRTLQGQNPATTPNNNPPNYIIDKETGKIIYSTHKIDQ